MANDVVPFGGMMEVSDEQALAKQFSEQADFGSRTEGISYMSFSGKRGVYQIGVDKRAPEQGEPWLVAIPSFKTGYICWKGGRPVSKRMARVGDPPIMQPDPEEGGPFDTQRGEGWYEARSIGAKSLLNGEEIEFTINSKSGVSVLAELHKEVATRLRSGDDPWPIVEFLAEPFEANGYRNDKPKLKIFNWVSSEDVKQWADPEFDPMTLLEEEMPAPKAEPRRRGKL